MRKSQEFENLNLRHYSNLTPLESLTVKFREKLENYKLESVELAQLFKFNRSAIYKKINLVNELICWLRSSIG